MVTTTIAMGLGFEALSKKLPQKYMLLCKIHRKTTYKKLTICQSSLITHIFLTKYGCCVATSGKNH